MFVLVNFGANAASSKPFHHPFGEWRQYHQHWLAVCPDSHDPASESDYLRTCWASTVPNASGAFFDQRLSVSRDRTTGVMSIRFVVPNSNNINKSGDLKIRFSSGKIWSKPWMNALIGVAQNEFQFNETDDILFLLSQMRSGNWLVAEVPMKIGIRPLQFSTIGLTAAMEFLVRNAERNP